MKVINIKVGEIFNRSNPRRRDNTPWNTTAELKELADSIKAVGILEPLLVRTDPSGGYELIAGSRRLAAAEAAGLPEVPCSVIKALDQNVAEIAITENMQRKDLDPFDEADAIMRLQKMGNGWKEIGDRLGKSAQFVARRACLSRLIPQWRELLTPDEDRDDCAPLGSLELIARYDEDEQTKMLEPMMWTVLHKSTKDFAEELMRREADLDAAPFDKAGCAACHKRSDFQPELFGTPEGIRCLDTDCYQRKVLDHVEAAAKLLEEKTGKKPVLMRDPNHYDSDPSMANAYDYRKAKKTDENAVPVVIATGPKAGSTSWMIPINRNRDNGIEAGTKIDQAKIRVGKQVRYVVGQVRDYTQGEAAAARLCSMDEGCEQLHKLVALFGARHYSQDEVEDYDLTEADKLERIKDPVLQCWHNVLRSVTADMQVTGRVSDSDERCRPYQAAEAFCTITGAFDFETLCAEAKAKFGGDR